MRVTTAVLLIALLPAFGCATSGGDDAKRVKGELVETKVDMPGRLFIRENHGIGSYDAFLIPPAAFGYRRGSLQLSEKMEEVFKAELEQSLIDASRGADIPIVNAPGECVMVVAVGFLDVDIERSRSAKRVGELTLAMEFRDSMTGDPLLRYEAAQTIENDGSGDEPSEQVIAQFDEMIKQMELSGALRGAGLSEGEIRPGCMGTLAERGRGRAPTVSAQ